MTSIIRRGLFACDYYCCIVMMTKAPILSHKNEYCIRLFFFIARVTWSTKNRPQTKRMNKNHNFFDKLTETKSVFRDFVQQTAFVSRLLYCVNCTLNNRSSHLNGAHLLRDFRAKLKLICLKLCMLVFRSFEKSNFSGNLAAQRTYKEHEMTEIAVKTKSKSDFNEPFKFIWKNPS